MADEFDHRLDERFARLRDRTMKFRPDLAAEFNACLPISLRGVLPRRVRLRLWLTGRVNAAGIWLVDHGHCGAAILLWRACRLW